MKQTDFSVVIEGEPLHIAAYLREAGPELLFLIHGLGCSKDSFHHLWNYHPFDNYSVMAVDLAGFGNSSKSRNFSYTMEAQAQICAEILSEFSEKKLHIVAHSMGGAVALLLPHKVLERTETFVNVEGNLIAEDCDIAGRKIISVPPDIFAKNVLPEVHDLFKRFGHGYTAIDDTSADALYRSARSLTAWSDSKKLLELFLGLTCRKAYFYGEDNAEHPTIASIGNVTKVMIKRSGHFPMNDNPEDFYGTLHQFVTTATMG